MSRLLSEGGLTLFVDFGSLPTYLALGGIGKILDETSLEAFWLPVVSVPSVSSIDARGVDPLAAYKARRKSAKRRFAGRELERNCERMGISEAQGARSIDSTNAALGLMWLHEKQADPHMFRTYIESVFSAVYREPELVEEPDIVVKKLEQCGVVTEGFLTDGVTGQGAKLQALQEEILELGILESPAFIYQGECFQGRQHLPLLVWLMNGSHGSPPA